MNKKKTTVVFNLTHAQKEELKKRSLDNNITLTQYILIKLNLV